MAQPNRASSATRRRQLRSAFRRRYWQWAIVFAMMAAALCLGYIGFWRHSLVHHNPRSVLDTLYLTLQLFTLQSGAVPRPLPWQLEIARVLAPVAAAWTILRGLAVLLDDQLQLLKLRRLRGHVVICGLGRKGLLLTQEFLEHGTPVVVLERHAESPALQRCRELGAEVLVGDATDTDLLWRAGVATASHLIAVCGDDGANAEIAVHAREMVSDRKGSALTCLIHIVDPDLCDLLREREIEMGKLDAFRPEFFNVFDRGARMLLDEHPPFPCEEGRRPSIVVVGLGNMGRSLVTNAARRWKHARESEDARMRVTVVDVEARSKVVSLRVRHPELDGVAELVPEQMDVRSPAFERGDFLPSADRKSDISVAYVCLDDESRSLAAALALNQHLRDFAVPVVARMVHDAGLASLLGRPGKRPSSMRHLHAFGLLDHTCTRGLISTMTYEIIARALHAVYVEGARRRGESSETNASVVPWEQLSDDIKESNRRAAEHIRVKLEAIGCRVGLARSWDPEPIEFTREEVERMAELEHERFVAERVQIGYRHGRVKDSARKTNPTLIHWRGLPEAEKEKDRLAVRALPEILAEVGFEIYRNASDAASSRGRS